MVTIKGSFVHLHLHSQYSLLDGAIRFPKLFEQLTSDGVNAVALTDHGNMFGAYDFYRQAKDYGIHPIIGCEVYVAPESRFKRKNDSRKDSSNHLILLAKNNIGYQNLARLVSLGYTEGFYYKPRVDHELLKNYHEGIIALSACLKGEIPSLILSKNMDAARERILFYQTLFGKGNFYLEIQRNGIEEQTLVNESLIAFAREKGIPLVATNDCHYLKRQDAQAHEVLLCLQTGKTLLDQNRMRFKTDEFYVKSPNEMYKNFSDVPEAIENTLEIARKCDVDLSFKGYHFPIYELPEGKDSKTYLTEKAMEGLESYFRSMREKGKDLDETLYRQRLEYELKTIQEMGFSDYFLIVSDFIGYAKNHQIPVGPGRGSAAGSLVSFALGITEIDPIPYKLMFERFLAPGRVSMPDIDCDFCEEKREQVIQYVAEKYGHDRVAQIITFSSMKAKGVIRDVGRVMGLPYAEVDRVAKLIPTQLNITIDEAIRLSPKLKELMETNPNISKMVNIARTLEGLNRHSSKHAAGVVISSKPLTEFLPIYKGQDGEILTQYDMSGVESVGLVKFDFLGLSTLSIIDRAVTLIREKQDPHFDLKSIDLQDKKTFALLRRGEVSGVFQLESSSGMRDLLVRMKPRAFEDIIDLLALYRPGPLESGMVNDYIKRRNNKKLITYEIPQLEEVLGGTYGVILYQEQVMQIAMKLAGFSPSDADRLRKAMGKKKAEEMAKLREKFVDGAEEHGIPKEKAEKLYDQMAQFAKYGFNKSHSTAYAMIAYQTAYLKAHYPTEFMAALLSVEMGNSDKLARYIDRCRRMGIEVLPPDVNWSGLDFEVEGGKIRFGLAGIKNVGEGAAEMIVQEREEGGKFTSFLDFCTRLDLRKVNKRVLESLIKCGAFDPMGIARARLFEALDEVLHVAQASQKQGRSQQKSLFSLGGNLDTPLNGTFTYPDVEDWPPSKRLSFEKDLLGIFLTGHPLKNYEDKIKAAGVKKISELADVSPRKSVKIAGVVGQTKEITTKKNREKMAFVTLEDQTGSVEVLVFPSVYKEAEFEIFQDSLILVEGILDKSNEMLKVKASSIISLDKVPTSSKSFHIFIPVEVVNTERLSSFRATFERSDKKGPIEDCHFVMHVQDWESGEEAVISLPEAYRASKDDLMGIESSLKDLFGDEVWMKLV